MSQGPRAEAAVPTSGLEETATYSSTGLYPAISPRPGARWRTRWADARREFVGSEWPVTDCIPSSNQALR